MELTSIILQIKPAANLDKLEIELDAFGYIMDRAPIGNVPTETAQLYTAEGPDDKLDAVYDHFKENDLLQIYGNPRLEPLAQITKRSCYTSEE